MVKKAGHIAIQFSMQRYSASHSEHWDSKPAKKNQVKPVGAHGALVAVAGAAP